MAEITLLAIAEAHDGFEFVYRGWGTDLSHLPVPARVPNSGRGPPLPGDEGADGQAPVRPPGGRSACRGGQGRPPLPGRRSAQRGGRKLDRDRPVPVPATGLSQLVDLRGTRSTTQAAVSHRTGRPRPGGMPDRPNVETGGRGLGADAGLWGSYGPEARTSVRSIGPSFGLWEPGTPIQIRAAPCGAVRRRPIQRVPARSRGLLTTPPEAGGLPP